MLTGMTDQPPTQVTVLLRAISDGDESALDSLISLVYDDLRRVARQLLRSERDDHTLQPTALVHEAYARLVGADIPWESRAQFYSVAARTMRRVLVDHARTKRRAKRGGGARAETLDSRIVSNEMSGIDLIDLDDALRELAEQDDRKAKAVELYYFAGLDLETVGRVLDVSAPTVHRDLKMARAWIFDRIEGGDPS